MLIHCVMDMKKIQIPNEDDLLGMVFKINVVEAGDTVKCILLFSWK